MRFLSYGNLMFRWMRILRLRYRLTQRTVFDFVEFDLFPRLSFLMMSYVLFGTILHALGLPYFGLQSTFTLLIVCLVVFPTFWVFIVIDFGGGYGGREAKSNQKKRDFLLPLKLLVKLLTVYSVVMLAFFLPLRQIILVFPEKRYWK